MPVFVVADCKKTDSIGYAWIYNWVGSFNGSASTFHQTKNTYVTVFNSGRLERIKED